MSKSITTPQADLEKAYNLIFKVLSSQYSDPILKENMQGSAPRTAKALLQMCLHEDTINADLEGIIAKAFPVSDFKNNEDEGERGIITQGPIIVNSMCPHHLLPIMYKVYVSYLPQVYGKVLGLSKLARIAKLLGKRPVIQEQLAKDIVEVLYYHESLPYFETRGSAVSLTGIHTCLSCRGVESNALTTVTEVRGIYYEKDFEEKFLTEIQLINQTRF